MTDLVFDIYPADAPLDGTKLVRLTSDDLLQGSGYRAERRGPGVGTIKLSAKHTAVTSGYLVEKNYVRVIDLDLGASGEVIGGMWLNEGEEVVLSEDEGGGKILSYTGQGPLYYLHNEVMGDTALSPSAGPHDQELIDSGGRWSWGVGGGETYGGILRRAIIEAILKSPSGISALTSSLINWDDDDDSASAAWPAILASGERFEINVGDNLLDVTAMMMSTGSIDLYMDPDTFQIDALIADTDGTDRTGTSFGTGVVRFLGGTNIASDLKKAIHESARVTHMLVIGSDGVTFANVVDPDWSAGDLVIRGAIRVDSTNDSDALEAAGLKSIADRKLQTDSATFPHVPGDDESTGEYTPGKTNGHYWLGDQVTLHTGTGDNDYNNQTMRVAAINWVMREAGDWDIQPELGATYVSMSRAAFDARTDGGCNCGPTLRLCDPPTSVDCEDLTSADLTAGTATNGDAEDSGGSQWSGGAYVTAHHSGTGAYGIATTTDGTIVYTWDPAQVFAAGVRQVVDVWNRIGQTGITADLKFGVAGGDEEIVLDAQKIETVTGSDGFPWAHRRLCWTPSADATGVRFSFRHTQSPSGYFYVDDLSLATTDALSNVNRGTGSTAARCDHNHNAEDLATTATDTSLVLAPDGSGGVEFRAETGGSPDAADVNFTPTGTIAADDVQEAVAEVATDAAAALAAKKLDDLAAPDDNTDLNASTSKHGLLPKLPGGTTTFLRADGSFASAGSALTVEEADGGPTDSAVTKIVFPNGTLAIASHVATVTLPTGAAAATIGDGSATSFAVDHSLGTTDIIVQLWDLTGTDPVEATGDASSITATDNDTVTVVFASAPAADAYRVVVLKSGGSSAGAGTTWKDVVPSGNAPGGTDDDEFADASLTGFTAQTVSGTATWTEDADVLSVLFHSQTAGDWAAQLKPISGTPASPMTIETAVRLIGPAANYNIAAVLLTNGTAATSKSVAADLQTSSTDIGLLHYRAGTLTDLQGTAVVNTASQMRLQIPWLHLRIKWTAANTFAVEFSPDGVTWSSFGIASQSLTMTPTHFGVAVSNYGGGTAQRIATFEYVRVS